jgi:hypothetical protein
MTRNRVEAPQEKIRTVLLHDKLCSFFVTAMRNVFRARCGCNMQYYAGNLLRLYMGEGTRSTVQASFASVLESGCDFAAYTVCLKSKCTDFSMDELEM